jgi:hypothetical protein
MDLGRGPADAHPGTRPSGGRGGSGRRAPGVGGPSAAPSRRRPGLTPHWSAVSPITAPEGLAVHPPADVQGGAVRPGRGAGAGGDQRCEGQAVTPVALRQSLRQLRLELNPQTRRFLNENADLVETLFEATLLSFMPGHRDRYVANLNHELQRHQQSPRFFVTPSLAEPAEGFRPLNSPRYAKLSESHARQPSSPSPAPTRSPADSVACRPVRGACPAGAGSRRPRGQPPNMAFGSTAAPRGRPRQWLNDSVPLMVQAWRSDAGHIESGLTLTGGLDPQAERPFFTAAAILTTRAAWWRAALRVSSSIVPRLGPNSAWCAVPYGFPSTNLMGSV